MRFKILLVVIVGLSSGAMFAVGWRVGRHQPAPAPSAPEPTILTLPRESPHTYTLTTTRFSHFALGPDGKHLLRDGQPYPQEQEYSFTRTIQSPRTALVVMDPWIDMASPHMNSYYGKITKERLLPLVRHMLALGHPVIVLTNDPAKYTYNARVAPELDELATAGQLRILYHQDYTDRAFAELCRQNAIDTLMYAGYASNVCVIGRPLGMIPMLQHGFKLYFIPDASAAVELPGTWQEQTIHHAATKIIAQWIGERVTLAELLAVQP